VDESSPINDNIAIRARTALIQVNCSAWCEVSAEQHAGRLWENEGCCAHHVSVTVDDPAGKQVWDEVPRYCPPTSLVLQMTTNLRGEVESADLPINFQESSLDQAELVAADIARLLTTYRATPGRL
jgi:hypothetical protein